MRIIRGDLLESGADFILQQSNCVTVRSKGLAAAIENRFPFCRPYKDHQQQPSVPGNWEGFHNQQPGEPTIVCLFAQFYPGPPGVYDGAYAHKSPKPDTAEQRLEWFEEALNKFLDRKPKGRLALPFQIGCGLAGGDWDQYRALIERLERKYGVEFEVYQI